MEQIGMWVMEGNRVEKLDPSVSGVEGIVIYKIPGTPSITNPAGAAAPEAASKRVIWISAGGKKLYTKKMAVADPKTDTTVISAATDEVQEDRRICYGIYRHSKCFHGKGIRCGFF